MSLHQEARASRRFGGDPHFGAHPGPRALRRAVLVAFAIGLVGWAPAPPTKREGCHVDGLLPDPACTPGAVATRDPRIICGTATRARRRVPREARRRVFAAYGLSPNPAPGAYEIDHLIPLELGGDNSMANLWPEAAPGFHDKDRVEDLLHRRVCSGLTPVDEAQKAIATAWTAIR